MTVVDTFSKREVRMEDFSRELESTKKKMDVLGLKIQ